MFFPPIGCRICRTMFHGSVWQPTHFWGQWVASNSIRAIDSWWHLTFCKVVHWMAYRMSYIVGFHWCSFQSQLDQLQKWMSAANHFECFSSHCLSFANHTSVYFGRQIGGCFWLRRRKVAGWFSFEWMTEWDSTLLWNLLSIIQSEMILSFL